jgi:putative endonuclease
VAAVTVALSLSERPRDEGAEVYRPMSGGDRPPERPSRRLGRRAEALAVAFLQQACYRIVALNQRVGRGEIDIIARRADVLAFVEVKGRRTRSCGAPEDAVTPRKQRQVARLASLWMASHPRALDGVREVRFDIIAVDAGRHPAVVRHLPAAFDAGDASW